MTSYLPSAQARKGKKTLNEARNLRDEWKDIIPSGDLIALKNRITMATEMGVGLDSKRGLRKVSHARAFCKYAEETLHIATTVSGRARDIDFETGLHQVHDDPEQLARTIAAAEATYRSYLSYKDLFPTPEQGSSWAKSVWPVACNKTGARQFNPPGDLTERLETVGSRFRADAKAKVTPLVESNYGFETDEASRTLTRNAERARDLKRDRAFVNGENGLPYRHPIIQQAINVIWFSDRRSEGVMFPTEFNPIPYEAIAVVLAVIECCLDEWSVSPRIEVPFTNEHYKETYVEHLAALKSLTSQGLHTRHVDPLFRLRRDLYDEGRRHAGVSHHLASDDRQHIWSQDRVNAACEGLPAPLEPTQYPIVE
ncbi:hypothetical protein BC826DRAFT_315766 [Russula brevipes]|nr:hypothetical protein BC826DRAFT_315766 [Russula brevipes]